MPHGETAHSLRYIQPIFEIVDCETDIEFGNAMNHAGTMEKLDLDIYRPSGDPETNRAAILWIHGGGFRPGNDKKQSYIVEFANRFARRGFVCISANYRVRENPREDMKGTMSDAFLDVAHALEWVKRNSDVYGIDTNRIIIAGGSAGGMITVNVCYGDGTYSIQPDLDGVLALVNLWGSPSIQNFDLKKNSVPTIIIHGANDQLVPLDNSHKLVAALNEKGIYNKLLTLQDAGHTPMMHVEKIDKEITRFLEKILKEA